MNVPWAVLTDRLLHAQPPGSLPVVRLRQYILEDIAQGNRPLNDLLADGEWEALPTLVEIYLQSFERAVLSAECWTDALGEFIHRLCTSLRVYEGLPSTLCEIRGADTCNALRAALARIALANLAVRLARAGPRDARRRQDVEYAATLFIDTHLSLLKAMAVAGVRDDSYWLEPRDGFAGIDSCYPHAYAVACVEELPNFAPLFCFTDLGGDGKTNALPSAPSATGGRTPQKFNTTLKRTLAHVFITKALPQKCHVRHVASVLLEASKAYPAVMELFRCVLYAMLAGNMPSARNRLSLAARLRIKTVFGAMNNEELIAWVAANKVIVIFILREHFIDLCEAHGAIEELIFDVPGRSEGDTHARAQWLDYKEVVRTSLARVRDLLSRQVGEGRAVDWEAIKAHDAFFHAQAKSLATCMKNSKGRASSILARAMGQEMGTALVAHLSNEGKKLAPLFDLLLPGVSPEHIFQGKWTIEQLAANPIPSRERILKAIAESGMKKLQRKVPMNPTPHRLLETILTHILRRPLLKRLRIRLGRLKEALHFCAWQAARDTCASEGSSSSRDRSVPPLKWLKVLGLPASVIQEVRTWVFDYCTRQLTDNSFTSRVQTLGKRDLLSYCIVQTYFSLFEHYREHESTPVVFRPIGEAMSQILALRRRLALSPFERTPPTLGTTRLCLWGCRCWATQVQAPPAHVIHDYDSDLVRYVAPPTPRQSEVKVEVEAKVEEPQSEMEAANQVTRRRVTRKKKKNRRRSLHCPPPECGVQPLVEIGDHLATIDLRDGLLYCARKKESKASQVGAFKLLPDELLQPDKKEEAAVKGSAGSTRVLSLASIVQKTISDGIATMKADRKRCGDDPLFLVDMLGIWYNVNGFYYGLCCYCGNLTSVAQEKITPQGLLSCMNHWHADLDPGHPHWDRMAFSADFPGHAISRSRKQPKFCAFCDNHFESFDVGVNEHFRIVPFPVCKKHVGHAHDSWANEPESSNNSTSEDGQ